MMKKYLKRKEILIRHQEDILPKVNQSLNKNNQISYRSKPLFNIKKQIDIKRIKT